MRESDIAISVRDLGKQYHYDQLARSTNTLEDWFVDTCSRARNFISGKPAPGPVHTDLFWALKDVSFDIEKGDVVGIIGRNGAGKSTLLKILSRITAPTTGKVEIFGRIDSLLEVGTGFHPEMSGRENIYMNSALHGLTRREIDDRMEDIIRFSGVEEFLDTPVKYYSSGMGIRLGFAVAAHMDPDILVVDEVLAVGDVEFQKKCIGKMKEVSEGGRTVLFVSHNMSVITTLCSNAMLLEHGEITFKGKTSDAILKFLSGDIRTPEKADFSREDRVIGNEYVVLVSGSIRNTNNEPVSEIDINEEVKICMEFTILQETRRRFLPQVHFFTSGTHIFAAYYHTPSELTPGDYLVEFSIPPNFLNDITYFVSLCMGSVDQVLEVDFYEENALSFNVRDPIDRTPGPRRAGYIAAVPGQIRPQFTWTITRL